MTLNDLFNQHINLTLFILEDLKATDNQKNLFRNLARQTQRAILKEIDDSLKSEPSMYLPAFVSDSRSKNNDNTK